METTLSARQFGAVRRLLVWLKGLEPGASREELLRQAEHTTGCDEVGAEGESAAAEAHTASFDLPT